MLLSLVVFGFGLIVTFIVALGLINAQDLRSRQRAQDFQFGLTSSSRSTSAASSGKETSTKLEQQAA